MIADKESSAKRCNNERHLFILYKQLKFCLIGSHLSGNKYLYGKLAIHHSHNALLVTICRTVKKKYMYYFLDSKKKKQEQNGVIVRCSFSKLYKNSFGLKYINEFHRKCCVLEWYEYLSICIYKKSVVQISSDTNNYRTDVFLNLPVSNSISILRPQSQKQVLEVQSFLKHRRTAPPSG